MRFLRDLFFKYRENPEKPKQDEPEQKPDVLKKVPDIGRSTPPPDGTHRDEIVVTSNQPLLEQNSKVIDSIIAEEYGGKITKR